MKRAARIKPWTHLSSSHRQLKRITASFSSSSSSSSIVRPPVTSSSRSRSRSRVVVQLGVVGVAAGAALGLYASQPHTLPFPSNLLWALPLRLSRDVVTAATIAADYKYSLWGLPEGSLERAKAKHDAHMRCAIRLRDLCFRNGGIYIKLGQHIGQLEYLVPQEYVETMRNSMLDRCPVSSYKQVCDVFESSLGGLPHEIFKEFNPIPLASASLAQVHEALTHDGKKVAVKVQHIHLTDTAVLDTATVKFVVKLVHWIFPNFDYRWLVDEIEESLPKEMDFIHEAKNGVKCMQNFKQMSPHLAPFITSPKILWELSTPKLLTMEFMEGVKVTDIDAIRKLGLHPNDVSKLIIQAFAEMIFQHGFVHCDPHAANMMVQIAPIRGFNIFGYKKLPRLVLLDHGLYRVLDSSIREHYASLWKALVFADVDKIKKHSVGLGAGEDLYILFAGVLTMRPWKKIVQPGINHLQLTGTDEDKAELQMYASQYVVEVSELLRRLPRVVLLLLKTNDCLRAVDRALGSSVNTFIIIGRESSRAVAELNSARNSTIWSRLRMTVDMLGVEIRVFALQIISWIESIRQRLQFLKENLNLKFLLI